MNIKATLKKHHINDGLLIDHLDRGLKILPDINNAILKRRVQITILEQIKEELER